MKASIEALVPEAIKVATIQDAGTVGDRFSRSRDQC
jgi:hypothetical protein